MRANTRSVFVLSEVFNNNPIGNPNIAPKMTEPISELYLLTLLIVKWLTQR